METVTDMFIEPCLNCMTYLDNAQNFTRLRNLVTTLVKEGIIFIFFIIKDLVFESFMGCEDVFDFHFYDDFSYFLTNPLSEREFNMINSAPIVEVKVSV